jgi:putative ABC transport system substrate-binding protein
VRETAQQLRIELFDVAVREPAAFRDAFAAIEEKRVEALVVTEGPMLIRNAAVVASLALEHRIPACGFTELGPAGGIVAYGVDFVEMWRRAAIVVDKILKGAKPTDIPLEQATSFRTILNLKTAKAIGLEIPTSLLLRADQVIE